MSLRPYKADSYDILPAILRSLEYYWTYSIDYKCRFGMRTICGSWNPISQSQFTLSMCSEYLFKNYIHLTVFLVANVDELD